MLSTFRAINNTQAPLFYTPTMGYCVPGFVRTFSCPGFTQPLIPFGVGAGVRVEVGGGCVWVGAGSSVWVGTKVAVAVLVAVAAAELPHAESKTIQIKERMRDFIMPKPFIDNIDFSSNPRDFLEYSQNEG